MSGRSININNVVASTSYKQGKYPINSCFNPENRFSKRTLINNFGFRKAKHPTLLAEKTAKEGKLINLADSMYSTTNIRSNDLLDIPSSSSNQIRASSSTSPSHVKKDKIMFVRNLRNNLDEQCTKLANKFSFDLEMMDDLKSFTKHKAALDKDYSQKLSGLVSQFTQKLPADKDIPETEDRSLLDIWKIILEACRSLSEGMGKISEVLSNDVCNIIRSKRRAREISFKRGQEQAQQLSAELITSAKELSKSHRNYNESEKEACDIRQKFSQIEAKQRGGRTSMFETHSHLEKNFSKTKRKVITTERKTTDCRNEYLMLIEAFNSHANKYQFTYMQDLCKDLSGSYFREMRDHMITIGRACVETFDDIKSQFLNFLTATYKTKSQYEVDTFLSDNPVFTTSLSCEFEPYNNDHIHTLSKEYGSYTVLTKTAQNLTLQVVQEQDRILQKSKAMKGLNSVYDAYTKTPEFGTEEAYLEAEQKIEILKREMRHSEINILRSESKLSLLSALGLDIEKYRTSAQDVSRTQCSSALTTNRDSKNVNTHNLARLTNTANQDRNSVAEPTPSLLVSKASGLAIGDHSNNTDPFSPRFIHSSSFMEASSSDDEMSEIDNSSTKKMATVLYSFQATTEEDISIFENEMVEIKEEEDNGWCWGVNLRGDGGYFPSSYVQVVSRPSTPGSITSSTSIPSLHTQGSTTSVQSHSLKVRSICAYDAGENDELSFPEGIFIQIVSKEDEDWWTGSYNGITGVFPAVTVEAEDLTSGHSNSSTSRDSSVSEPTVNLF
ncbi:F-BAR and double SH3 domains protein 2 [Oopsacas minuta]|uniref:F-BAR and double SH3 domains protein 2 n=1 Tax=Oopsacas minuta TaxID=111878 RepID=A0AAV7JYT4_9METZ|nr:F-BAR and double SH3 domains protein 2 [Oopsacas minuta]